MTRSANKSKAIVRLPDGTVKQHSLLSGTEVWTVPGRGHRPLGLPSFDQQPLDPHQEGKYCAFCEKRYLDTPPEKSRLVRHRNPDGTSQWEVLSELSAEELDQTVAEFRRIPNLFEIVSYQYWHLNHGHMPSSTQQQRMAKYLASPIGYDHVMRVIKAQLLATGMGPENFTKLPESEMLPRANGFFAGGHDVIAARHHFVKGATDNTQLAAAGTLTPEEHNQYVQFTIATMADAYSLNDHVAYVAAFQNWLRPAGASFDHLHKQVVAIDERSVQTERELERLRHNPKIYDDILEIGASRKLVLAQNDHAVAMAGFGHRFPTISIWPLGPACNPWDCSTEQVEGVSDLLHAVHAATGANVPCNEEWYHRPPSIDLPVRWRILLKWRISTLAGFEGGTRIYLNTIDPWGVRDKVLPRLEELRAQGKIAPMRLGSECKVQPQNLY